MSQIKLKRNDEDMSFCDLNQNIDDGSRNVFDSAETEKIGQGNATEDWMKISSSKSKMRAIDWIWNNGDEFTEIPGPTSHFSGNHIAEMSSSFRNGRIASK